MKKTILRISIGVIGFIIIAAAGLVLWLNPGRGPVEQVDPHAKGWSEEVEGTLVLHLAGTPYEMGYQRGYFAKDRVLLTLDLFENLLKLAQDEMGLPRFATHFLLDLTYQLCSPFIPDRYKREMEGLADASGCDLKMLRRGHIISVLTERGCSAFAVWGKATEEGKLFHGRNFDWILSAGLEDTAVLALYEPEGFNRFASAGYAGIIGVLSGMNMEGISISQIGAVTKDSSLRGLPLEFVLRRLLEETCNLEEASELMNSVKHTVGFNYVVADGDAGDARAYETTAHHMAVFGPGDPKETVEYAIPIEDAVFRSDEAMDPLIRSLQDCANAPGQPYGSNSYDHRYMGIATRIQERYGDIDADYALEILKATAMDDANLHGVLTNSTDREMWVAHADKGRNASLQQYVHYDLKQLFLRPEERAASMETADTAAKESGAEEGAADSDDPVEEEKAEETES
ncbi:MAG: hypothetical protein GX130_12655 [Candidatus Hydrogenedens sp.]|jgi:hypothetical protein|nr:hypothetical protein [Candidatus Hydrogenedens sp.]